MLKFIQFVLLLACAALSTVPTQAQISNRFITEMSRDTAIEKNPPWYKDLKHFWVPFIGMSGTATFDIETTQHMLKTCVSCYESNPIVGTSRAQEYGINIPFNFAIAFGIHRVRREGTDWLQGIIEGAHTVAGISNLRQ